MTKICFLAKWGQDSTQLLERFRKQTPGDRGVWKNLQGVSENDSPDWYVILGDAHKESLARAPEARRIYIQRELPANGYLPPEIECAIRLNYDNAWCAGIWWVERPFDVLAEENKFSYETIVASKTKALSTITTAAILTPGQRMRLSFLKYFHQKAPGQMEVWGKDQEVLSNAFGEAYQGRLPYNGPNGRNGDKWLGLRDYRYTFCFENCSQKNYFSEKLLDAYLSWCMPFYWGCENYSDFFPDESSFWIDIALPSFDYVETIASMVVEPLVRTEAEAIREARQLVLYKYNLWAMIQEVLKTGKLTWPIINNSHDQPGARIT